MIIERQFPTQFKQKLVKLLRDNADIFAWEYSDMTGIPRTLKIGNKIFVTKHKLNDDKKITPKQQKKRDGPRTKRHNIQGSGRIKKSWNPPRNKIPKQQKKRDGPRTKRHNIQGSGRIKKSWNPPRNKIPKWVANTVMVKKTDGAWRMCVDFTDINKTCPKDCYSLPEIDWKVDSLSDFKLKCFLDVYKGYHQIQMAREDENKTAFHAPKGVYCYRKMPLGLKNTGATYQRNTGWKLYTDGESSDDGSRAGLMIDSPEGLRIAKDMKIDKITIFVDSQLVANQVNGSYEVKHHYIKQYLQITKELLKNFRHAELQYSRRNQNKKVDALSKLASLTFEHLTKKVLVEKLANKSIYEKQVADIAIEEENS
ncbi:reverse transcriptase domain-containing protein [Tanacetum coccineum]